MGGDIMTHEDYQKKISKMEHLFEFISVITSTFSWEEIMENIVKKAVNLIDGADTGTIFIYDPVEDILVPEYGWGLPRDVLQLVKLKPGEGVSGNAFLNRVSILNNGVDVHTYMDSMRPENKLIYKNFFYKGEKYKSNINTPIVWKDECLGVMSIRSFSGAHFTQNDMELLEYIAPHIAVAIANTRTYQQQKVNISNLNKLVEVRDKLTQIVLNGDGLKRIAVELSRLIFHSVYIYDTWLNCIEHGQPDSTQIPVNLKLSNSDIRAIKNHRQPMLLNKKDEVTMIGSTILAEKTLLGYLIVQTNNKHQIPQDELAILEIASSVIALEMLKKKATYEAEKRVKVNLFNDTLMGNITDDTLQKLSLFGYDATQSYVCMVCSSQSSKAKEMEYYDQVENERIEYFCKGIEGIVIFPQNNRLVILYPVGTIQENHHEQFDEVYGKIKNFVKKLEKSLSLQMQVGVGCLFNSLENLPISAREARNALLLLEKFGFIDQMWTYRSLGPLRLLLKVTEESELKMYIDEVLGPLLKKDPEFTIINTLLSWFKNDRSVKQTAEDMYVHINTIFYRLKKTEHILNIHLKNEDDLLSIQIALRLWEVLYNKNKSMR